MEATLKKAYKLSEKLSPDRQRILGEEIIFEIENEKGWDNVNSTPENILNLAKEAREDFKKGTLESLDPDSL